MIDSSCLRTQKIKKILSNPYFISVIFFLGLSAIFFVIGNFPKTIQIYPDELRYYDIAHNMYLGDWAKLHNIDTDFQKILYPMLLSPFFAIQNQVVRIQMITLLNSILISSSVFPILLISKKITDNKKIIILSLVSTLFLPALLYSTTFMSEVLFYPIALWLVYFWLLSNTNKKNSSNFSFWFINTVIGFLCYLLYLCKETAIVFLCSFFVYEATDIINSKIKNVLNKNKLINSSLSLLVIYCSFFLPFLIFKFTVFYGMGGSYNQTDLSAINTFPKFCYMFYGFVYFLVSFSFAMCVLPILMPIFKWDKLNKNSRSLFLLTFISLVLTAGMVAYTITVREDLWKIYPRVHLRYAFLYQSLFIILAINSLFSKTSKSSRNNISKKHWLILGINVSLIIFIFKGVGAGSYVDQFSLSWYQTMQNNLLSLFSNSFVYYVSLVSINILYSIIIILVYMCLEKKKQFFHINNAVPFIMMFIISSLCNTSFSAIQLRKGYEVNQSQIDEVICIDNYIKSKKGNALYVCDINKTGVETSKFFDTYYNNTEKLILERKKSLEFVLINFGNNTIPIKEIDFTEVIWDLPYKKITKIEYIIMDKGTRFDLIDIKNLETVETEKYNYYSLYKNKDPQHFYIEIL